jgi:hypothetical protein
MCSGIDRVCALGKTVLISLKLEGLQRWQSKKMRELNFQNQEL